jgi:kynurenine formamidase
LQAAPQRDALSHVYYEQKFYNGFDANTCTSLGASKGSIDKPAAAGKVVARGVLLDVAKFKGQNRLDEMAIVLPEDLDATAQAQGVEVGEGDVVLVRTGHWTRFLESHDGLAYAMTSPGLGWQCGKWLSDKKAAAVACDNMAVETGSEQLPGVLLPMHLLCLRDMGMMLGEMWNFEGLSAECASDGKYEFLLVAAPLQFTGAVGSPLNPIAIK